MKTYKVTLTKSCVVKIKAETLKKAQEYSQLFTSDMKDISTIEDENRYNFEIEEINCKLKESAAAELY